MAMATDPRDAARDAIRVRLFQVAWKMSDMKDPLLRLAEAVIRSSEHFVRVRPEAMRRWAAMTHRRGKRRGDSARRMKP